ncbi:MAG: DUF2911 domain-containing protein [Bacteroidota bacterium]
MKKKILLGFGGLVLLLIIWVVYGLFFATPVSPPATVSYNEGGLEITIDYSQPSKKGRLIFGEESEGALQPYGKYWRLGANAATEISFSKDVTFGGKAVDAGTYRMYAVPSPETFDITLNSETDVFFGAAEPDYDLDVLTIEVPVEKPATTVETFIIEINSADKGAIIEFKWAETMFSVPVSLQ